MSSTITIRVEENVKKEANNIFKEVGMDMSTAINIYLKQVIRSKGIPFPISADIPNAVTLNAIKEAEKGEMASFSSIDELMEDLND
ncbi:type II toxin-antitoxin system RelB/DinJ family antitoxin [Oribacterium sp. FC2011]|uniref:type II toxin-antitoxin system RelB/DinJ family antitoxin n=1 Tax=Oribacterium sp. FC2011 TaxID=1408311 RepID=UPI0004E0E200|nr:type II toxin-antitoxin system RelB/DinJ family antitoxin [Oribacterium sp. FC2011]